MARSPFFSILTASLNKDHSIRNTLESVKKQTCHDLEHIVIDGGSSDESLGILSEYEAFYNLSWISETDRGIADALNKGFGKSLGTYLLVLQADDQLLDQYILERIHPLLRSEFHDIYSFPVILDHPVHGPFLRKPIRRLWWNRFKFIFPHQGCCVHRRVFEKIGGFSEQFSINMDYDFFYRALSAQCTVKFGDFPVTVMGGEGIGTDFKFASRRLKEERLVQILNERNPFWRLAQVLFRAFYVPYRATIALKYR